jgi:hypothetical protein
MYREAIAGIEDVDFLADHFQYYRISVIGHYATLTFALRHMFLIAVV